MKLSRHLDIYNNYRLEGVFASIATLPMLRKLQSRRVDCEEKQLNQVLSCPLAQRFDQQRGKWRNEHVPVGVIEAQKLTCPLKNSGWKMKFPFEMTTF